MNDAELSHAAERLRGARHVAVLTGAGISAESGIATFRDPDGLWQRFKPEELANVNAFLANPERVQGWYAHRRAIIRDAEPNPAHRALAALESRVERVSVITQNVDGLHTRAGSTEVMELHGSLERSYCAECARTALEEELGVGICPACGGRIRPDVVWFGETLPHETLEAAAEAATTCDVFLSVGTSAVVYPAADLPLAAVRSGAWTAEVNVERSAIAGALDLVLAGRAGQVLPALVERMGE